MALPSRSNPLRQEQSSETESIPPKTMTEVKELLTQSSGMAISGLIDMLATGEPQHRIAAAKALIAITHGKEGLQIQEDRQDYAKDIASLLQQTRKPINSILTDFETKFTEDHPNLTPHQYEAIALFVKAFLGGTHVG